VQIPITLINPEKGEEKGQACANAFHEKAGRSQVDSRLASLNNVFSPAEQQLSPCFHSHSRGAMVSLGACWAFSVQPVLQPD
jgi:hypothetical protein